MRDPVLLYCLWLMHLPISACLLDGLDVHALSSATVLHPVVADQKGYVVH
jgi:hypothetical protein